jgi:hypothetical protein
VASFGLLSLVYWLPKPHTFAGSRSLRFYGIRNPTLDHNVSLGGHWCKRQAPPSNNMLVLSRTVSVTVLRAICKSLPILRTLSVESFGGRCLDNQQPWPDLLHGRIVLRSTRSHLLPLSEESGPLWTTRARKLPSSSSFGLTSKTSKTGVLLRSMNVESGKASDE